MFDRVCAAKMRKTSRHHPASSPLLSASPDFPPQSVASSSSISPSASFLAVPVFLLCPTLPVLLSSLSAAPSSSLAVSPPQRHLSSISVFSPPALHVFAAIFSPYLEPDIFRLSMILKWTPGRIFFFNLSTHEAPPLHILLDTLPPYVHHHFHPSDRFFTGVFGTWHWT